MVKPAPGRTRFARLLVCTAAAAALAACSDQSPVALREPAQPQPAPGAPAPTIQAFECTGSTHGTLSCKSPGAHMGAAGVLIGGQNTNLKLTSSNVSYNSGTEI